MSRHRRTLAVLSAATLLIGIAAGPGTISACETTRFQVPSGVCARSAVMAVSTPGSLTPGVSETIEVDLFLVLDPNGGTCPTVLGATTTVDLVGPSGVVATGSVMPALIGSDTGSWNRFAVPVSVPGALTPGLYTLEGSTAITLSSGPTVTALSSRSVWVTAGPVLSIEPLTTFLRDAPGNPSTIRARITNLTLNTLHMNLTATSEQIARRPDGGTEASGIFSISNPTTGDDFTLNAEPADCFVVFAEGPAFSEPTVSAWLDMPPGAETVIELGVRSFPDCRDGACSQVEILLTTLAGDTLGVAGVAAFADTRVPPAIRPHLFTEFSGYRVDSTVAATYFGGTVWDAVDARWEAIPAGTWTFDSGVGSSRSPVSGLDPGKDPALHTLMEGWIGIDLTRKSEAPGPGGDWSTLVHGDDLPDPLGPCGCNLTDSVLVFQDGMGHGLFQDNIAASPWIDLGSAGAVGRPGKFVEFKAYADLPAMNYVFLQVMVQSDAEFNAVTGNTGLGPFATDGFVYYQGSPRRCTTGGEVFRVDMSHVIPPAASQVRIGLGVVNYCRFWPGCSGLSNSSPWFDDVRLGVYGSASDPAPIAVRDYDRPQDNFPTNGTVNLNATGRIDAGLIQGALSPEIGTSLGDTLVVRGGKGNAEVYVQFQVDPGPGVDGGALATWLGGFTESPAGWYSARMDTAEVGGVPAHGYWMTALHEEDPAFSGSDTDLDPEDMGLYFGGRARLLNDIFPDNLFAAGTRINLFYKTRTVGGGVWTTLPPGIDPTDPAASADRLLEWECLPSSMAGDGTWNCVLLVNHGTDPTLLEAALQSHLGTGSANFEGTNWDRYDVRAPGSNQASFGGPLETEYGTSLVQALTANCIVYDSGPGTAFNLTKEDGDILVPWLSLIDFDFKNLYLSGDNLVSGVSRESAAGPSARRVVQDFAGALLECDTFRDADCPESKGQDLTACVGLDPVAGAKVAGSLGRATDHVAQGNGCPELRSFDVLLPNPSPDYGTSVGDEAYATAQVAMTPYASLATDAADVAGTPVLNYRIVVDGVSVTHRRDVDCLGPNAIDERVLEVLTFLGHGEGGTLCSEPSGGTGVTDERLPGPAVLKLLPAAPNPLPRGAGVALAFTLPRAGEAKLTVFDLSGRRVATPFDGIGERGLNEVAWNGRDDTGRELAAGVYFYRLATGGKSFSAKLVVLGR